MRLNPQHFTVSRLMQGRLFRIPDYQRAYSWQKRQRADLFADIIEVQRSGRDHFMATVVGLAKDTRLIDADEFGVVELVDGQQRITTLVILIKAIEKALDVDDATEAKVRDDLRRLLVKGDDHNLVLLQTNHDSSDVFASYVRDGEIRRGAIVTAADGNVVDAAIECEAFVAKWTGTLVDLVATIRHKLSMIYHELDDEGTVYRVFEVLNSRGLDVRWIDKTKSQMMASIYEYVEKDSRADGLHEMQNVWKAVYRRLGLDDDLGDEALRFAGTWSDDIRPNRVLSEQDASAALLKAAGSKLATIIRTASWLKQVVSKVVDLHTDQRRAAVTRIGQARFLAIAIMLRGFDQQTERMLLGAWERVTFRIFTLAGKDSRTKVGEYVRLGYDVLKSELSAEAILEALAELGDGFEIDDVIDEGTWDDWYGGYNEEVRYLLFRYEEHLAATNGTKINDSQWAKVWATDPAKSIEHIMPQSSGKGYVHGIGNLTMLPPNVNSSLRDKPPEEKAARYVECGMNATMAVGREIDGGLKWNKEAVRDRAARIEAFVRTEWGG
ncbi:DUF262 domain-containing HNH endonuclease family protein [Sphingomonas sp.]|uniref:DUF262 domain-containing protein n=1 Tax=Sphingomonas sp. TaxID=28214 RepID=UPI000DBBBAA3|nr:DUF262 domain-containing HNH endonuclease family protein [Sphingomonas sp.]PZT94001.1 MAG: DUF262 domain-containing protein [Sphingomonas sp.]